jgi:C-terminal processing protease CtpA/Prc
VRRARKFQQITGLRRSRRAVLVALVTLVALAPFTACASQEGTIGAVLGQRPDGRLFVRDVPPALAAARAGLQPGDEILLVDGKDVRAMDAAALHQALSGEVSAPVKLTVVRGETVFRVTLPRTLAPRASGPSGG